MSDNPSFSDIAVRLGYASTFLFVPGDRPDRFESAWRSKADVVILDLEASVHPDNKALARAAVSEWLQNAPGDVPALVRLNRPDSRECELDLQALTDVHGIGLMCSGAETGPGLDRILANVANRLPVVLLVETARGIEEATALASLNGVCRLAFGNMDYATELDLGSDVWGFIYPSSRLVVASRCAGLPPPVAGVTADISDLQTMERDTRFERSLGFGGKMCIHPGQLPCARQAFVPSEEECIWARRIIEATEQSHAVKLDGQMVDRPVIERAERILARLNRNN